MVIPVAQVSNVPTRSLWSEGTALDTNDCVQDVISKVFIFLIIKTYGCQTQYFEKM